MGRDFYCGPISKEAAAPVLALASAQKLVWTPQKWRPNSADALKSRIKNTFFVVYPS